MNSENCIPGLKVRFKKPGDNLLDGETGVVVDRPSSDEALIRFDTYRAKFDGYEDLQTGSVTADPAHLEPVST